MIKPTIVEELRSPEQAQVIAAGQSAPTDLKPEERHETNATLQSVGARRLADAGSLATEIAALGTTTYTDLRFAWRRLYRVDPPKKLSRDLLELGIAWKLQERVLGGFKRHVKTPDRRAGENHGVEVGSGQAAQCQPQTGRAARSHLGRGDARGPGRRGWLPVARPDVEVAVGDCARDDRHELVGTEVLRTR